MRGGAERTRTPCQAETAATTWSRNDWQSAPIGAVLSSVSGRQGRSEILPRRLDRRGGASVVRGRREPNGGSQCPNLQRSDQLCLAQRLWLRQTRRHTPLIPRLTSPTLARSNLVSSRCCSRLRAQRLPR